MTGKNLILIGLIFLVLSGSFTAIGAETPVYWERAKEEAKREGYFLVTYESLKTLYDSKADFMIVDVRPCYEYKDGHLPKAVNLEFDLGDRLGIKPEKREAFEKLLGPDKDRLIVIYCRSFR